MCAAMKRGILGMKKDPKNPMFFSFAGGEQWPSSDSSDSDYHPDGSLPSKKRPAKSKTKTSSSKTHSNVKKKNKETIESAAITSGESAYLIINVSNMPGKNSVSGHTVTSQSPKQMECDLLKLRICKKHKSSESKIQAVDGWGQMLPSFILLKIFKLVVDSEGPLPFLCRAAKVNRTWNKISCESVLWRKLDLSFGWIKRDESTLSRILETKNLSQLREINLNQWNKLTNSGIQILADNCSMLTSVSLSGTRLNSIGIMYLIEKCSFLHSFDLSSMKSDSNLTKTLHRVIEKRGNHLQSLNLSSNSLKYFNASMKLIASTCCKLQVLDLSNVQFSSDMVMFDIEKMQACCTHLKILRLCNSPLRVTQATPKEQIASPGFPELMELALGISSNSRGIGSDHCSDFLHRMLKRSCHLKLLDLRGCTSITCESLQSLPITDLQQLYISSSSAAKYEGIEIIMTKWQHSLVELDLSWNIYPGMSLDMAMKKLASDPAKSKLEILDLRGTQISCARVKSILEGCPRLNCLYLESCRGLPRGMKKEYSGLNLDQLRKDITSLVASAEQDVTVFKDLCTFF